MIEALMEHFPALVPFLTAIAGGVVTILVARATAKKDITVSNLDDRSQLSKDQYALIAKLHDMMERAQEDNDELREEMRELQKVNIALTISNEKLLTKLEAVEYDNKQLQSALRRVTRENQELKEKIEEMNRRLDSQV